MAIAVVAAIGDFSRFATPDKLVAYLGLNPRVRQSGNSPAVHGRITKAGPAQARMMTVLRTAAQQGADAIDYLTRFARPPTPPSPRSSPE